MGREGAITGMQTMMCPCHVRHCLTGKQPGKSFFQPFEALAQACQWDNNEKLFRLTSCLRGEAAEYAFGQLPPEVLQDFTQLEKSLGSSLQGKTLSKKIGSCSQRKSCLITSLT